MTHVGEIKDYFKNNCSSDGLPLVPNPAWKEFILKYSQDDIKIALADHITENSVPFPLKKWSSEQFRENFHKFSTTSMLTEYREFDNVLEKIDYKFKYSDNPLGVIDKSHTFNLVSNYFQQENRMKCGSNVCSSPWDIWHDNSKLRKMNWHFWRAGALGKTDIGPSAFRSAFRIGTYTATQFRPSVAKALYEKHGAINVLDTSCGWGDRLAAFYATDTTELYVGCDPNPEVYSTYIQQCMEYEKLLTGNSPTIVIGQNSFTSIGKKRVEIYNLPSEDVDWSKFTDMFDLYFTSPPYWNTEQYALNNHLTQSWHRYPQFDDWKNNFLNRVHTSIWPTLRIGSYMMINIIDPGFKNRRLALCDDMVNHILSLDQAKYIGKIGMRLQARPHSIISAGKSSAFIEPVWVFRKGVDQYSHSNKEVNNLFEIG